MRSTSTLHTARAAARILTMAAVLGLLSGCMLFRRPPEDLDYSRTRVSESERSVARSSADQRAPLAEWP